MAQCDNCKIYLAEYDNLRRTFEDVKIVGEETDNHYCVMFEHGIEKMIYEGKQKCPHIVERGENNEL